MKVKDVSSLNPKCVSPDTTLTEAARGMQILDVGMLPVCEGERVIGTVTDRDIALRGCAQGADPNTTTVREVMTADITWCFEDQDVDEAAELMERRRIRRLPVLNHENKLVGIVTLGDLVRAGQEKLACHVLGYVCEPMSANV